MELTRHATERMQQRGIPPLILDACIDYGSYQHTGRGATLYYFDKRARRRLERKWGRPITRRLSKYLDTYVVIGENGAIITMGKRFKRIKAA